MAGINVDHDHPGAVRLGAGSHSDVRVRPPQPPPANGGRVGGGLSEPVTVPGVLAGADTVVVAAAAAMAGRVVTRDDGPAATGQADGDGNGVEGRWHVSPPRGECAPVCRE